MADDKPVTPKKRKTPLEVAHKASLIPHFLEAYKQCENQTEAAQSVGINPTTISRWKKDPKFLAMFNEAHLDAQQKNNDGLKRTTIMLGIGGNPHYIFDQKTRQLAKDEKGKLIVLYREFYPNLNQFLLKNRLPEEFKDKFEHEVTGQIVMTLASEFLAIVRRVVPAPLVPSIQKELENLSSKLSSA